MNNNFVLLNCVLIFSYSQPRSNIINYARAEERPDRLSSGSKKQNPHWGDA